MKEMKTILEKVYENKNLRSKVVPLFIGNPGMGKTKIIEAFAKEKGAELVELITSQMSPFEISGIAMPDKDSKKMTYYNFDKLEKLKDGDILFFDELLNGNPIVLNACLTILEQRRLISGKDLPEVMIVAAANPQGMVPLTPQIKERFLWYNVEFDPDMWKEYMYNKYSMPYSISENLCKTIQKEEFRDRNFNTPRSIDKAVSMVSLNCPTPYSTLIENNLSEDISNFSKKEININGFSLKPDHCVNYLSVLRDGENAESHKHKYPKEGKAKANRVILKSYKKGSKMKTQDVLYNRTYMTRESSVNATNHLPLTIHATSISAGTITEFIEALKSVGAEVEEVVNNTKKNIVLESNTDTNALFFLKNSFGISEKEAKSITSESQIVLFENCGKRKIDKLTSILNSQRVEYSLVEVK